MRRELPLGAVGRTALATLGPHLARLPGSAARAVGAAIGELDRWSHPAGRRGARAGVAAALPRLGGEERALLVRRAYRHQGRVACDNLVLSRAGDVALCRALTLEGWDELATAAPTVVCVSPLGNPEAARRALALYLGPEAHVVDLAPDPRGPRLPFLESGLRVATRPAELCRERGAPLVVAEAQVGRDGRLRLRLGPSLEPPASGPESERVLLVAALAAIEKGARERLEQWPWMGASWRLG